MEVTTSKHIFDNKIINAIILDVFLNRNFLNRFSLTGKENVIGGDPLCNVFLGTDNMPQFVGTLKNIDKEAVILTKNPKCPIDILLNRNKIQKVALKSGDCITIGAFELIITFSDEAPDDNHALIELTPEKEQEEVIIELDKVLPKTIEINFPRINLNLLNKNVKSQIKATHQNKRSFKLKRLFLSIFFLLILIATLIILFKFKLFFWK